MVKLKKNTNGAQEHMVIASSLIRKRINSVISKGSIGRDKVIALTNDVKNFLENLLIGDKLENLILTQPEDLTSLIRGISINYPNFINPNSDENLLLRNVFVVHGYNHDDFDKLEFIKRINVDTCPYCNRSYIYYLSRVGKIKPQIDHFYPTNLYPFLALTFYNLIPSCQTCNGFGAKEGNCPILHDMINPYLIENEDFEFTYKIKHINFLNPLMDKNSVELLMRRKIDGNTKILKLDQLYQQHSDHLLELIIKSKVSYSDKYRTYLKSYAGLKFNNSEIDRMILGNYSEEDDIHKRPLSKLYQDIGLSLGLIKRSTQ
ncbi:hypothetical protein [Chryseobacterium geocarposphaerae]|uniref:HNH endonuclease n=1 Tax=Chryseobacterium geocarposphaerae TaxID=1416776 RepID=A0A2M9C998_9FLAO|nr:hypothetical protein [Chryseobacterium geocarposphaerae]PJJ67342.1 hypothetical protein CLV73_1349 [Chryseobacterium geocarposphaerae]